MPDALTLNRVTRRFGAVTANDSLSFTIAPGEILGLLGHNGAGKTTLVSQIAGLLRPHSGSIHVADVDAVARPATARTRLALQPQAQAPLDGLTPRQAITYAGQLRGLSRAQSREAAESLAEELAITDWLDRRALPSGGGISGGIRRLTAFAMAVVTPLPLVILDEPTNDIDAARRRLLWDAVRRRGDDGSGVLVVTHNVTEAERIIDTAVILDHGTVLSHAPTESFTQSDGLEAAYLRLTAQAADQGKAANV